MLDLEMFPLLAIFLRGEASVSEAANAFFVPFAILPHETFAKALFESARTTDRKMAEGMARALLAQADDSAGITQNISIDVGVAPE